MYTKKIGIAARLHDEFIQDAPLGSLLQSASWANIKSNWRHERIGIYQEQELVTSISLLIRPLLLGYTLVYIPRGIVMDYSNQELVSYVIATIKDYAKSQKAIYVTFDPLISVEDKAQFVPRLTSNGAVWQGETTEMHDSIQPRYNALIKADQFSLDQLDKKTKQFLRKANNSHPIVTVGGQELLEVFDQLMQKTAERKSVGLRNAQYYRKLLNNYPDDSYITLIQYDFGKVLADVQGQLTKNQAGLEQAKNVKRQKSLQLEREVLERNQADLEQLIAQDGPIVAVAGTLTLSFSGKSETLYAGTDTRFQKYYPSYLAWYETIQHSFAQGNQELNMGGLENSLSETDGLLQFKRHFLTEIAVYIGEFDLPIKKIMYRIAKWFYKRRRG